MISIIGIIVAILAIGISIAMSFGQVNEVLDYKFFVNSYLFLLFILIILTGSMGLLRYRIKDKSRKMVYYTIVIEVLEELLDSKNDSKSIEIENVLD